jgi:hypothetical protein
MRGRRVQAAVRDARARVAVSLSSCYATFAAERDVATNNDTVAQWHAPLGATGAPERFAPRRAGGPGDWRG